MVTSGASSSRRTHIFLLAIILAGCLVQLYRIDLPLLGMFDHRMCDTAAIARNFAEGNMSIFYPQIDWGGNSPGYVESEFPIYQFIVAALYRLFGVHEYIGRLLNIIFYGFSALFLFRLVQRIYDERIALLSVNIFSFSSLVYRFSRGFQPDVLMCLGGIAGLYYFDIWIERGQKSQLILSAIGCCIAILIKPISLFVGAPMLYLCWRKWHWSLFRKWELWIYAAFVTVLPALWFWHAFELWRVYGSSFGVIGWKVSSPVLGASVAFGFIHVILNRILYEVLAPYAVIPLLVGFFVLPTPKNYLLHWWAFGFGIMALFTWRGQYDHSYYQLPLAFVLTTWTALGIGAFWRTKRFARTGQIVAIFLCIAVIGHGILAIPKITALDAEQLMRVNFADRLRQLSEPDALVISLVPGKQISRPELYQHRTQSGEFLYTHPVDFYLSHRKGWSLDRHIVTPDLIKKLHEQGARYFATFYPELLESMPALKNFLKQSCEPLEVTSHWAIYRLDANPYHARPALPGAGTGSATLNRE